MVSPRRTNPRPISKQEVGLKYGFRSGLEEKIARELKVGNVKFRFEEHTINYTKPAMKSRYTPDFVLENGVIIESKGRFVTEDRKKMKLIKEQHPDLDIRIVFSNSRTKISKKSQTTYAMWCEKVGILYADKEVPEEWINEPVNTEKLKAIERFKKS